MSNYVEDAIRADNTCLHPKDKMHVQSTPKLKLELDRLQVLLV